MTESESIECHVASQLQGSISEWVQNILKGKTDPLTVAVHIGTDDVCRKREETLQSDFRELDRMSKRRKFKVIIAGLLPVPCAGKGRNEWLKSRCITVGLKYLITGITSEAGGTSTSTRVAAKLKSPIFLQWFTQATQEGLKGILLEVCKTS